MTCRLLTAHDVGRLLEGQDLVYRRVVEMQVGADVPLGG
jgi:hypothetical protein